MKKLLSRLPRWLRGTLLGLLIAGALGGGIYGVLVLIRSSGEGVNVYPVSDLSMSYASSGNAETGGNVRADRVQAVYTSSTQQVTRIHVREGQKVSVGDQILTFDTTLTDLELERQAIAVRQLELDLENAKKEQAKINTYRVFSGGGGSGGGESEEVTGPSALGMVRKGAGTQEDPAVIIWNDSCQYDEAFWELLFSQYGDEVYAVFEVRQGDAVKGSLLRSWEMILRRAGSGWSFSMIAPEYDEGGEAEGGNTVHIDTGVSFSYAELVRMKQEAAQKIINVELDLRVAKLKYDTLKYELNNGVITSQIDGVVKTVRDPETALSEGEPVVLISGGGGFYVTGALSETELSGMKVGDTVSVLSWETYETQEATITEISEYPAGEDNYAYHYSNGNQNVSLYPFTAFLPEDAGLREGEYVQISYTPGTSEDGPGLCLQNAFIRKEGGRSYILCAGEDGKLEQRWVRTGRSLWGSYTEILGDLDVSDWVAFPYGKAVRAGVKTNHAGVNELYNNY